MDDIVPGRVAVIKVIGTAVVANAANRMISSNAAGVEFWSIADAQALTHTCPPRLVN